MLCAVETTVEPSGTDDISAPRVLADGASVIFHPERLDVLVHLRAFEQLLGGEGGPIDDGVDWVATSDAIAADDVEPTVRELAARWAAGAELPREVVFGTGGRLVAGATSAAAGLFADIPVCRRDVKVQGVDRSQAALTGAGFTAEELRGAIDTWLRRDPRAAVIVVDHQARFAAAALAEIERRYEVFHSEFDHFTPADATDVGIAAGGSMHVMTVRVNPMTIDALVDRHGEAIAGWFAGAEAAAAARRLFDPDRRPSSSPGHARALRARRRRTRQAQVIAALRAITS